MSAISLDKVFLVLLKQKNWIGHLNTTNESENSGYIIYN